AEGVGLNMVCHFRKAPNAYQHDAFPEFVLISNLFGRATHNLVLGAQLKDSYDELDRELQTVAAIQRSLLPLALPDIPRTSLAAHYSTSRRAGGDYYDFFPLPDHRWGILLADVSGH